jgi:hypothetical protein
MLELAKIIHEAIGIQSPRLFIALCFLLFGTIGGGLGWAIDKGYRMKLAQDQAKTEVIGKPALPPPTAIGITIDQSAKDSSCSNVVGGKNVTVRCTDQDNQNATKRTPKEP